MQTTAPVRRALGSQAAFVAAWWRAGDWARALPALRAWGELVATRVVRVSPDQAEDIGAELMVRAWRAPVVPDDPMRWAARVVFNLSRDLAKSAHARAGRFVPESAANGLASPFPSPDAFVYEEDTARTLTAVRAAIRTLPDRSRRCFVLTVWHGQSSLEVGPRFDMDPAAVRMRVTRARRHVARHVRRALSSRRTRSRGVA